MKPLTYPDYIRWLRAAYIYYFEPEKPSGMTDHEWDMMARAFYAQRDKLSPAQFPVIHNPDWEGGSLYWLPARDYPSEARNG